MKAHVAVAHVALEFGLGDQCRHRVHHDEIDGAGAHECLGDLQGLLSRVGLADEEVVNVDSEPLGVVRIHGVFSVHECRHTPLSVDFRHGLEREGGLS